MLPIEFRNKVKYSIFILGRCDAVADTAHVFADVPVKYLLPLLDGGIISDHREAIDAQILLKPCEIILRDLLEELHITLRKYIYGTVARTHSLTGQGEWILIHDDVEGNVIPPEILVEAEACSYIK